MAPVAGTLGRSCLVPRLVEAPSVTVRRQIQRPQSAPTHVRRTPERRARGRKAPPRLSARGWCRRHRTA
eukprot:3670082-Prymnesium_polylepis.1